MAVKKFAVTGLLLALTIFAAGIASAQGNPGQNNNRPLNFLRDISSVVEEETGLTGQEITAQLRDGSSLAEIIEGNGGNVETVISTTIESVTTQVNDAVENEQMTQERADELLADLESRITDAVNGEGVIRQFRDRFNNRRDDLRENVGQIALLRAASELTELSNADLAAALRDSETLAAVIEDNGSRVADVIAAATTAITEQVNQAVENERMTQENADELLANLETSLTERVNSPLEGLQGRFDGNRPGGRNGAGSAVRGIINTVAEATGLDNAAVLEQVQAGNSLASILAENNVDVDSFIDTQLADYTADLTEQVEAGRMSQAVADARLNLRQVQLTEALNRVPEVDATTTDTQA